MSEQPEQPSEQPTKKRTPARKTKKAAKGRRATRRSKGARAAKAAGEKTARSSQPAEPAADVETPLTPDEEKAERRLAVRLDHVDRQLIIAILADVGLTQKQLGELVGLRDKAVRKRINRPLFQSALRQEQLDLLEQVKAGQLEAVKELRRQVNLKRRTISEGHARAQLVRFRAARELAFKVLRPTRDDAPDDPTMNAKTLADMLVQAAERYDQLRLAQTGLPAAPQVIEGQVVRAAPPATGEGR